jgi:hypothetical protein
VAKKKSNVVHLRNRALEFIKEIENGFNGVNFFELEVNDPTDPTDDDMGAEAAAAWDRDYVCMTIGVDFDEFGSDNDYMQFDYSSFMSDFRKFASGFFGKVEYFGFERWSGSGDVEVYRTCPEYEKWKKDNGH